MGKEPKSFRKARWDSHDDTLATTNAGYAYGKLDASSTVTRHAFPLHTDSTDIR